MSGIQLVQLPSNVLDALQVFANTAWHNPSAFQCTHQSSTSRDVEYLYLQDHAIALRYLFGLGGPHNQILVREEYRETLQALQTDNAYAQGVYIIGQPGVGKTNFLIYALIERLKEHKPVAVQLRASDPFYAFFTHTCTLHSLSDPLPLLQEEVWALSDLRGSTSTPLDVFQDVPAKVVQATLPNVKYWKAWSRHRGAGMFVMKTWSEEEIADLSSLLKLDIDRMVALAKKWGGVPRTLLQQCKKSESQQDWELRASASYFVENYATFLPALHSLNIHWGSDAEAISTTFFILPFKDHAGDIHRCRYDICVPTMALENALAIAFQQIENATRRDDLFLLMTAYPGTRNCVKNICLNWFHSLAASQDTFRYSWNHRSDYNYLSSAMSSVGAKLPIIRGNAIPVEVPYYWIPPSGEFSGIDCVLVTGQYTFAIQVPTTSKPSSSSPQIGLDKLRKLLPARSIWIFLTFGISKELVENACAFWRGRLQNISSFGYWVADPVDVTILHKVQGLA